MGKKCVLLGLVEPVDFVDKEDGAPLERPLLVPGFGDNILHVGNSGSAGREPDETGASIRLKASRTLNIEHSNSSGHLSF